MTSQDITVQIREDDGSLTDETRTLWASEYGPVIDFPGLGWSDALVAPYRDANIDNNEFVEQFAHMYAAQSLDEFIEANRAHQVPGARDPGLVPWDELPMVERTDMVFNANESFTAEQWLDGVVDRCDMVPSIDIDGDTQAWALLLYSNGEKDWRTLRLTDEVIEADAGLTITEVTGD